MVRHIILWKVKEEYAAEKDSIKAGVKEGLEGLKGQIEGLQEIKVHTNGLASSNADVMLESSFASEEALKAYAVHPKHVDVANGKVRPFMEIRLCIDFEE